MRATRSRRAAVVGQRFELEHVAAPGADALAEALAAGFLVEAGPGRLEFRHALVRDAVYQAIPWTRRRSLHASRRPLARREPAPRRPSAPRTGWGRRRRARARGAGRGRRGLRGLFAYGDAAEALRARARPRRRRRARRASSCSSAWPSAPSSRAISRPRRAPGARSSTGGAGAARSSASPRPSTRSAACSRCAAAPSARWLRGSPPPTRSPPADGTRTPRARASRPPTPCRTTARLQPALAAVESALADLPADAPRRAPLARPLARRDHPRQARQTARALESVRDALAEALSAGHPATAAAAYQALAVVHENAGELGAAAEAFEVAIDYCASAGVAGAAHVCSACLCHVLRQRGEWRRSLALCRSLLDDPSVDEVIARDRGGDDEPDPREPRRAPARPPARAGGRPGGAPARRARGREECSWTFARLELLEGSDDDGARALPRRPAALGGERGPPLQPERARPGRRACSPRSGRTRT